MAKFPHQQLRQFVKQFGRWLNSPPGERAQQETISILSQYIQSVMNERHPAPASCRTGWSPTYGTGFERLKQKGMGRKPTGGGF